MGFNEGKMCQGSNVPAMLLAILSTKTSARQGEGQREGDKIK